MMTGTGNPGSRVALLAALGLLMVGVTIPAAQAADLGGDCCSDLEQRVAELEATTARKGNRKVSLTISGEVSTGFLAWDDGVERDTYIVDNSNIGSSYFSFAGNAKISPNLNAGFNIAVSLGLGARAEHVSQDDDDGADATGGSGDSTVNVILANWYLDHKQLGRITVGRINTASAGATLLDLGGTSVAANSMLGTWNRSFDAPAGGFTQLWYSLLGAEVNSAGISRANAISYSTPTFGGLTASASWGEDDQWDAAVRYAGEHAGFRIAAAAAYAYNVGINGDVSDDLAPFTGYDGTRPSQWKGSVSVLHVGTGLFGTFAYVNQDNDTFDPGFGERANTELYYFQGGIARNWTGLGNTVLYGEYSKVVNPLAATGNGLGLPTAAMDADTQVWGVGVVQHVDAAALELFLAYRHYEAEVTLLPGILPIDVSPSDFDAVFGGARIRF